MSWGPMPVGMYREEVQAYMHRPLDAALVDEMRAQEREWKAEVERAHDEAQAQAQPNLLFRVPYRITALEFEVLPDLRECIHRARVVLGKEARRAERAERAAFAMAGNARLGAGSHASALPRECMAEILRQHHTLPVPSPPFYY